MYGSWIYPLLEITLCLILQHSLVTSSVSLEWKMGSALPVSKVLDPGSDQDLFCSVTQSQPIDMKAMGHILLQCPLSTGACAMNCEMLIPSDKLSINCTQLMDSLPYKIVFKYRIKVTSKKYEGVWKCQHLNEVSRAVTLTVTKKPYITQLTVTPTPVWRGSQVNVTCYVMPMLDGGRHQIIFERVRPNGMTARITKGQINELNEFTKTLTLNSVEPGEDDVIQCTVYTTNHLIARRAFPLKIYYFPDRLVLRSNEFGRTVYNEGDSVSLNCTAVNGYPTPNLVLFKELSHKPPMQVLDSTIFLTRQDNNAKFICKMDQLGDRKSNMASNEISVTVEYPPENIQLLEDPKGSMAESKLKIFTCQNEDGSQPRSLVTWRLTDTMGRNLSSLNTNEILNKTVISSMSKSRKFNTNAMHESVSVVLKRKYNGFKIMCFIEYKNQIVAIRKLSIQVNFSPDIIEVNSNPLGSIQESTSLTLTCVAGSSYPAPKLKWYKNEPGNIETDVTADANIDKAPGNYSGIKFSSHLKIHGVSRNDHGTIYRCEVGHICMSTPITKEYYLKVFYPPSVSVYASPELVEQGDQVQLYCRTSGGNPHDPSKFRYRWAFCPPSSEINSTHMSSTPLYNPHNKPPIEIRKNCGSLPYDYLYPASSSLKDGNRNPTTINISSVSNQNRGYFSCSVYSSVFSSKPSIGYYFLNVLYPPIIINISPSRVYADLSSDLLILVKIFSNPPDVKIKWYYRPHRKMRSRIPRSKITSNQHGMFPDNQISMFKTEIDFKSFGRFQSALLENFTLYFKIVSLKYSDLGQYSCEISNRLGKKTTSFEVFSSNAITIPESSIEMIIQGQKVIVTFNPPNFGHFSHLILRMCRTHTSRHKVRTNSNPMSFSNNGCRDMHVSNPLSGQTSVVLQDRQQASDFIFRLMLYNGSQLLQTTKPINHRPIAIGGHWVEMSMEMMVSVIIAVTGIFILLFIAFLTLILLRCRQRKRKDIMKNNSNTAITTVSNNCQTNHNRQDFLYLNSLASNSISKGNCHCFSHYPIEMRSDNGSDQSMHSQNFCHPTMMVRKMRDNGEMESIHSGGSHQSPDLLLTERTSLTSASNHHMHPQQHMTYHQPIGYAHSNGSLPSPAQLPSHPGNNPKLSFVSARRFPSMDNNGNSDEYMLQNDVIFAAVDDPMLPLANQARLIPISPRNFISASMMNNNNNNNPDIYPYNNFQLTQFLNAARSQAATTTATNSESITSKQEPSPPNYPNDTEQLLPNEISQNNCFLPPPTETETLSHSVSTPINNNTTCSPTSPAAVPATSLSPSAESTAITTSPTKSDSTLIDNHINQTDISY